METPLKTAKMKLVTIIAAYELEDRLVAELRALKTSGFTVAKVNGYGAHGPRKYGILDGANLRIETLVSQAQAGTLLRHLLDRYADLELVAYALDVEAIPHAHFA